MTVLQTGRARDLSSFPDRGTICTLASPRFFSNPSEHITPLPITVHPHQTLVGLLPFRNPRDDITPRDIDAVAYRAMKFFRPKLGQIYMAAKSPILDNPMF
jgi:hypothetical protein